MKRTVYIAILSAAALVSCAKADWESGEGKVDIFNPDPPVRRAEFVTFNASLESVWKVKSSLDLNLTHKLTWEKGDRVLVRDAAGKRAVYEASTGGSETTVLVRASGDTLAVNGPYEAWYPESYVSGELGSAVWFDEPNSIKECPMSASGMKALDFKSECGVISFTYNPDKDFTAKQMVLKADQPLCEGGVLTCDLTKKSPLGMNIYSSGKNVFSFFAPVGKYSNLSASFIADKDTLATVTLEYELETEKNTIITVDLNSPEGKIKNLSRHETANCYMINLPGDYVFKATRGPSAEAIEGISDVQVLWQTDEMPDGVTSIGVTVIDSLRFENGRIFFSTPWDAKDQEKKLQVGNALIGALDADGNILWSWHIWAINSVPDAQQYDEAGNYYLMDRSLGTLGGPSKKGSKNNKYSSLLYQFGRKDPLMGYCMMENKDRMVPDGLQPEYAKGPVTVAEATAHPTTFYYGDSLWCSESPHPTWSSSVKTEQDPCPPGYIVPSVDAFRDENGPFYKGCVDDPGWNGSCAFVFGERDLYCFVTSSCLKGTTGARGEKNANYTWTSAYDGNKQAMMNPFEWDKAAIKFKLFPLSYRPLGDALSVRCMKILQQED